MSDWRSLAGHPIYMYCNRVRELQLHRVSMTFSYLKEFLYKIRSRSSYIDRFSQLSEFPMNKLEALESVGHYR